MALRCKIFGHKKVPAIHLDTELNESWATKVCDRCDRQWLDTEREASRNDSKEESP